MKKLIIAILLIGIIVFGLRLLKTNKPVQQTVNKPDSLQVLVNKQHPLNPKTYVPAKLVVPSVPLRSSITDTEKQVASVTVPSLTAMVNAARQQDVALDLQSGYRSYEFQSRLYNNFIEQQGKSYADSYSARPGYSEHQTGLAIDFGSTSNPSCNIQKCFAETDEGKWLAENAYKYGFILRYPLGKESITGYGYEPWHYRFVGNRLAQNMRIKQVKTLEELLVQSVDNPKP